MTVNRTATSTKVSWLRVLRVAAGISSVLVILQAVLAGQMLATNPDLVAMHEWGGHLLFLLSVVIAVAGVLARRRQEVDAWVAGLGVVTFLLIAGQMYAGYAGVRALHVPLGVTLLGVTLVLLWSGGVAERR